MYKENLFELFNYYKVTDISDVKEEYREDFIEQDLEEEGYVILNESCLQSFDYSEFHDFDEVEFQDYIETGALCLGQFHKILGVWYNHTWDKRTGLIFWDVNNVFTFGHDVSVYLEKQTEDYKILLSKVASHDNPMGSHCLLIGLTEKEYEDMKDWGFDKIIEFSDKKLKEVKE